MKRRLIWIVVLAALVVPGIALAQSATSDDSVLVAVDRDVTVAAGDSVGTLVVVSGNALIAGHVQTAVAVDGVLTIEGTVEETVVAVNTDVTLAPSAIVHGDIVIPDGELTREPGSTVDGSVNRNVDLRVGWVLTVLSFIFWIGVTIALLIAGLVLVAIARRQVTGTGELLSARPGASILATVLLVIGLPLAAVIAFVSVVGIPVGLALLLIVLPLLWTVGYLVTSARIGRMVLGSTTAAEGAASPYGAVLLGVLLLQIIGLVPVLGGLVIAVAATYGAGGLALYAWRAWRTPERVAERTATAV